MGTRMLSKQAIFDKVSVHLMKQMKKSKGVTQNSYGNEVCRYRSDDGLSCAVGCLLTDQEAHVADQHPNGAASQIPLPYKLRRNKEFLEQLQSIHDLSHVGIWYNKLKEAAEQNKLSWAKLDQAVA